MKALGKTTLEELLKGSLEYSVLFTLMFMVGVTVLFFAVALFSDVLDGKTFSEVILTLLWITAFGGIVLIVPLSIIGVSRISRENELLKSKLKARRKK
jgi:uncharacterized membrane protein (DUF485 family)